MLHAHPIHRSRQLKWVLPAGLIVLGAVLLSFWALYHAANQDVQAEFWKAHKNISHTGELLERGLEIAIGVLVVLLAAIGFWALRVTHRVVRPIHTVHRAVDELAAGNIGIRLELHRSDEFQEVGEALNRLADNYGRRLTRIHELVDQVEALAAEVAKGEGKETEEARLHALTRELDETMEFFRRQPERTLRDGDDA